MIGAHTDSPCLRLKPNPAQLSQGWLTLGIETYGGVLLNTWFDRDLGLAGRVQVRHQDGRREKSAADGDAAGGLCSEPGDSPGS